MEYDSTEKFPVRYDVHKYLGRKQWHVVSSIIKKYTSPEDIVLDLFSGSGVGAFEALRLKRKVIAVDYSQLSEVIVRSLCEGCDIQSYHKNATMIITSLRKLESVYSVKFANHAGIIKYWMPNLHRGKVMLRDKTSYTGDLMDVKFVSGAVPDTFVWSHAEDKIPFIEGSNVSRWSEIFTERTQYILHSAFSSIMEVNDLAVRRCLLVAFSASLEKASLLNKLKSNGKGWIREDPLCYYKPFDFIEFNAVDSLENKLMKMEASLIETEKLLSEGLRRNFVFMRQDAAKLAYSEKVDLILMDPPYLSEVLYDKLEALHDVWLGFKPSEQNIKTSFEEVVLRAHAALHRNGTLVLLMSNYLPGSKEFFIDTLIKGGFVQISETKQERGKKEGLLITAFKKSASSLRPK